MTNQASDQLTQAQGGTLPRLGLGCGTFGREIGEAEAFALMDYAVEHGITLFDTAEAYGGGQARAQRRARYGIDDHREVSAEMHSSEKIVGRWFKSRGGRDRVTLVTKVSSNFNRAAVRAALTASLARLQTDRVEFYLYHSPDPKTPAAEAATAMADVIQAGLARRGGLSNTSVPQLREALQVTPGSMDPPYRVVELCGNLLRFDHDAYSVAREAGLDTLAYSPLAAGFLTGKYTADAASIPRGTRFDIMPQHAELYFGAGNFALLDRLHALAREACVPAVQLAVAWVCHQPMVSTVLIGARHTGHLANALTAVKLKLQPAWLEQMNRWHAELIS
ncbi:MAG: aldo/keto reductase [Opitutaceae bacterium]|nr:aldo/keto reductase [Opitutaceae bacterium]